MWRRIPQDIRDHLIGKNRPEPAPDPKSRVGFQPGPGLTRQGKAHVLNPEPAPDPGELALWNVQLDKDDLYHDPAPEPEPDPDHAGGPGSIDPLLVGQEDLIPLEP